MKIKNLNQEGISHYLVPIVVVLVVSLIGVRVLMGSHADTLTATTSSTSTSTGTLEGPLLEEIVDPSQATAQTHTTTGDTTATVNDTIYFGPKSSQTVNVVQPGQTLAYQGTDTSGTSPWNGTIKMICYSMRVPYTNTNNTPQVTATLELENYDNYKTVKFGSEGVYSSYCFHDNITDGPDYAALGWSVKNVSPSTGPAVYVYQKTIYVKS